MDYRSELQENMDPDPAEKKKQREQSLTVLSASLTDKPSSLICGSEALLSRFCSIKSNFQKRPPHLYLYPPSLSSTVSTFICYRVFLKLLDNNSGPGASPGVSPETFVSLIFWAHFVPVSVSPVVFGLNLTLSGFYLLGSSVRRFLQLHVSSGGQNVSTATNRTETRSCSESRFHRLSRSKRSGNVRAAAAPVCPCAQTQARAGTRTHALTFSGGRGGAACVCVCSLLSTVSLRKIQLQEAPGRACTCMYLYVFMRAHCVVLPHPRCSWLADLKGHFTTLASDVQCYGAPGALGGSGGVWGGPAWSTYWILNTKQQRWWIKAHFTQNPSFMSLFPH